MSPLHAGGFLSVRQGGAPNLRYLNGFIYQGSKIIQTPLEWPPLIILDMTP